MEPTALELRRLARLSEAVVAIDSTATLTRTAVNTVTAAYPGGGSNPAVTALIAGWDWSAAADAIADPPEVMSFPLTLAISSLRL